MTDILCRWLNDEVNVTRFLDQQNFAKEFATGYLLGEVLYKHGLQDDFPSFSQSTTADSRLNNFTRLEPTLKLLEVPYDTNVARAVMNENHGATTRLMYQLFIALGNKNKRNLTGVAMETMRPSGPVKLESIESGLYKERLKQVTKRQVDLNFENLILKYQAKQKQQEDMAFRARFEEEEKMRKYQQAQRQRGLEKSRQAKRKQEDMMNKIKEATVKIPKPPDSMRRSAKSRSGVRRQREIEEVKTSIDAFEASMKAVIPPVSPIGIEGDTSRDPEVDLDNVLIPRTSKKTTAAGCNDDYINKIRTRLEEDAVARKEREKRRRRVLVEQLKAHEAQEEAHREEMLVNRLMRQSQQERRIAVQLMQIRHEKEVIRQNRILNKYARPMPKTGSAAIVLFSMEHVHGSWDHVKNPAIVEQILHELKERIFREKQYGERRLKDFDDALTREAEMCRQAKIEFAEETRKGQELHDKLMEARAQAKYIKHYNICSDILSQIVDFSCRVGEYRELTEKLIPPKLFREWKSLFIGGIPLYEDSSPEMSDPNILKEKAIEEEKINLLDEGDFMEYKNLMGEWLPPESSDIKGPPKDNAVLGHIIQRLFNIVSPPEPPPPPPEFPPFPIKVCLLGKFFSGKTTTSLRLVQNHRLVHLSVDDLVAQAIKAHKNGEIVEVLEPEERQEDKKGESKSNERVPRESRTSLSPTNVAGEGIGEQIRETPKENEDPNKQFEKQTSFVSDSEEKRDKTKEEVEKESEAKEKSKSAGKGKEQSTPKGPQPTSRARLGSKAYGYLKKGKATPDQLLVDIMVEAVRQVPEGTGWLMDGFPSTLNQAKLCGPQLLEKALSGYDPSKDGKEAARGVKDTGRGSKKKSRLAPDPHPPPEALTPKSGIDVVILFELPDEVALKRAEGRTYNPMSGDEYHQEYNPPVEGSYTGINKQERVVPVTDSSNDREQVQQRITGFLDAWPKLEKWFTRFGTVKRVNADILQEELYEEVAAVLNETYLKLTAPPEEIQSEVSTIQPPKSTEGPPGAPSEGPTQAGADTGTPSVDGTAVVPSEAPSEAGAKSTKSEKGTVKSKSDSKTGSKPGSPKGSKKGKKDRSPSPPASKKGTKSRSPSPSTKRGSGSRSPSPSKKGSRPGSRGSRPGSKRARSPKKEVEEVEEEKPPEPQGPPEPEPGSEDWEYADHAIEKDFASVMSHQWESVEDTYVSTSKLVFRTIRNERELIYRYFYGTRVDFVTFLKRPDEKQEYVIQWQMAYNDVAEDMRSDEETKSELHQQVDDLCDRLHDICDSRKEMAEKERQSIMTEGWLEDRLGILTNHYITLMQVEVDRYQDTIRLLRDYYSDKVPGEQIGEYARLPLVELPLTVRPQSSASRAGSESGTNLPVAEKPETKTPSAKREKDKDKDKSSPKTPEPGAEGLEEEQKPRIPLVPRRPKSGETGTKGKDKKAGGKKDKQADVDKPDTPLPPSDPDEKLVFDGYILALGIIETLNDLVKASLDQADQEAEAQRLMEQEKEKEREALAKKVKDKKGGKGRKSPAKGGSPSKTETPPPLPTDSQEGQSEEEQQKQKLKEKCRKEFLGALAAEDNGLRTRLEMIKVHACSVLQELKGKAEETYKDMDEWLGQRFLQEVESIKEMSTRIRYAIEKEEKLQDEQLLEDKNFVVDLDTRTFKTPTPPPPPQPMEIPLPDTFTIAQLLNLYAQFSESAPSGVISNRAFSDTIMEFTALAHGMELLPDAWMNITPQQLQDVCSLLSPDSECINWRKFLLAAAQPWPRASKMDLLLTLDRFRSVDTTNQGHVNSGQFSEVELWFTGQPWLENPEDPDLPPVFDRQGKLPSTFFQVLADQTTNPPILDYVDMLLYFAMDPDPMEGFLRALSVVTCQPMPSSKSLADIPNFGTDGQGTETGIPVPEIKVLRSSSAPPEMNSPVSLADLMTVFHHGESRLGDSHRLSVTEDPSDTFAKTRLAGVFVELGAEEDEAVPFHVLYQHPIMQDCMQMCQRFKAVDLKAFLKNTTQESFE